MQEIYTFHGNKKGRMREENVVRVFSAEGMKAAHLAAWAVSWSQNKKSGSRT